MADEKLSSAPAPREGPAGENVGAAGFTPPPSATAATNGPRTAPWESYDVGDEVQVRDPWYGFAVPRLALVKAKDPHGPAVAYTREDRPRVKVRYLDTQAVTWVAAKRIAGVVREVSSGV